MIDTTQGECQAWKYMNLVTRYAMTYQTGYDDLISASSKIDKLYSYYTSLRDSDPHRMSKANEGSTEPELQRELVIKGRTQTNGITESIISAKGEICINGN